MRKVGKSSKKGFTLVELIVVLVILAVLAAMLVPALVGYIDRAKKEKEYQAASTVYAAAQALATETYGKGGQLDGTDYTKNTFNLKEVKALTGVDVYEIKYKVKDGSDNIDKYTIDQIEIKFKQTDTVYYAYTAGGEWSAPENSSLSNTMKPGATATT